MKKRTYKGARRKAKTGVGQTFIMDGFKLVEDGFLNLMASDVPEFQFGDDFIEPLAKKLRREERKRRYTS